jgi:hypothetical protein
MSTNLEIIEDALRDINVISEIESASAEQGKYALRKFNQLMEVWREQDVEFGWFPQISTTADSPVPDWAELGITNALSVVIAPKYGATISPELAAVAQSAIGMIKRKSISEKLTNTDMSHLPIGSGHYYGDRRNILTDS